VFSYNQDVTLHEGDVRNTQDIESVVSGVQPDEIYNLASLSQVQESWNDPALILDTNFLGLVRIIEAVKHNGLSSRIKILNVSTFPLPKKY
jgi:GDPmannose 4,6-dehydratase